MEDKYSMPVTERISVLAATILFAYILSRYIDLPERILELQLPGLYLAAQLNTKTVVTLLVAGLTATGADWLLRAHPKQKGQSTVEHWLLPTLTAWVSGTLLFNLESGLQWWLGFVLAGIVLMLVLMAEYIVLDPEDSRHPQASIGLTALSFALFLALAINLHATNVRLFLLLPALTISAGLVSLRTLHLRLRGKWTIWQSATIALIGGQFAAALHYLPITSIAFGMALIGPIYAMISYSANSIEQIPLRQALIEPLLSILLFWGIAVWVR